MSSSCLYSHTEQCCQIKSDTFSGHANLRHSVQVGCFSPNHMHFFGLRRSNGPLIPLYFICVYWFRFIYNRILSSVLSLPLRHHVSQPVFMKRKSPIRVTALARTSLHNHEPVAHEYDLNYCNIALTAIKLRENVRVHSLSII